MVKRVFSPARRLRWRTVTVICICVAVVGFIGYFAMSPQTGKEEKAALGDEPQPVTETETNGSGDELRQGIILEETRITVPEPGGALGWSFGAERIQYDSANNRADLVNAEGIRFLHDKPAIKIRAGVVKLDFETGNVDFEDYVTVKSDEGISFSARGAIWDPGMKKFRAYGDVRYKNGVSEIFGDEMEIDPELETARVKGNARLRSSVFHGRKGGFAL